jgi:hypothetical protein
MQVARGFSCNQVVFHCCFTANIFLGIPIFEDEE